MAKKYMLALDQGTTNSRAIVFNKEGEIVAIEQKEIKQFYPQQGWVEQDANEIWATILSVIAGVLSKSNIHPEEIAAIGISNQRETTVIWDKQTGRPIYRAIVWQSRQSASICDRLKEEGYEPFIRKKTGLVIDPYFSASKISWLANII